jgi:hypothetical protein
MTTKASQPLTLPEVLQKMKDIQSCSPLSRKQKRELVELSRQKYFLMFQSKLVELSQKRVGGKKLWHLLESYAQELCLGKGASAKSDNVRMGWKAFKDHLGVN